MKNMFKMHFLLKIMHENLLKNRNFRNEKDKKKDDIDFHKFLMGF